MIQGTKGIMMKDLMAHLNDETLWYQLVRYHNTKAYDQLRDIQAYVAMLVARIESADSRRVYAIEVDVIAESASSVSKHLQTAEACTQSIAADKSRAAAEAALTDTDMHTSSNVSMFSSNGKSSTLDKSRN